jgi:hypothetical protein
MRLPGVDPYTYLSEAAGKLDSLTRRDEIETVLDEVEYLFEVIPPELQDLAEPVIEALRQKLANCP